MRRNARLEVMLHVYLHAPNNAGGSAIRRSTFTRLFGWAELDSPMSLLEICGSRSAHARSSLDHALAEPLSPMPVARCHLIWPLSDWPICSLESSRLVMFVYSPSLRTKISSDVCKQYITMIRASCKGVGKSSGDVLGKLTSSMLTKRPWSINGRYTIIN